MSSSATKLVPALCPSNCLHLGNTPQPFSLCRAKWFAYYRGQPQAGKDLKDFQLIVEPQISTWKAAWSILAHWSSSFQIGLQKKTCIYKIISLCMHATLYDHIDMCTYIYIYIYYIYNTRVDTHFYTYVILYYTNRIPAYLKKIMNKIHGSPILVPTIWNYNRTTETYIYII